MNWGLEGSTLKSTGTDRFCAMPPSTAVFYHGWLTI